MSTSTNIKQLDVVIPKDKFGDHKFIFTKLMETSLDVLQVISQHSDQDFVSLVKEFLPDLKNITQVNVFLAKWGITIEQLNGTAPPVENTPVIETKSAPKVVKKVKRVLKKSSPSPTVSESVQSETGSVSDGSVSSKVSSKKLKLKKIKKVVKKSKAPSPAKNETEAPVDTASEKSVSTEKSESSSKKKVVKKKLKLKKPKAA